ncbi:MAG TPA: iron ABC transporter permease [Methylomirabilota bacterium]
MPRASGAGAALARRPRRSWGWPAAALLTASLVSLPILTVVSSLTHPAREVWAHLWRTQLPELLLNTIGLVAAVGAGALVLGTTLAWLVVTCEFPGRRVFEWALVLPLALPAYVIGFVFLGLFEYAGPVQALMRQWLGPGARLPDLRSGWGVALMMTLVYYPYVYTLGRVALAEQAPELLEGARALGRSRLAILFGITLPLARPALAAGTALACMEALADFGTVATFSFRTLTEAIYRVWLGLFDRSAATQLAAILLALAGGLLVLERLARGRARYTHARRLARPPARVRLRGLQGLGASVICAGTLALAFGLPVGQLLVWASAATARDAVPAGLGQSLVQSLGLAAGAALLVTAVAVLLAYALRRQPTALVVAASRVAGLGYALPGAVIAVGVLLPLAWLDRALAAGIERLTGEAAGLVLTGSVAGLVFAYLVRFLAVGSQTVEASLAQIPRSLDEAARSLGARGRRILWAIHLPLAQRGLRAALTLVFVDVMKELPATLLLRPAGLETLAIVIWRRTAESLWDEAALPALALVLAGLGPVVLAMRVAGADPHRLGAATERPRT